MATIRAIWSEKSASDDSQSKGVASNYHDAFTLAAVAAVPLLATDMIARAMSGTVISSATSAAMLHAARLHGITHLQYQLLLHIRGFPDREWATVSELAERLQAHHHGVVSLISRCGKLGLVQRQVGRNDRREVEVHLTPKGDSVLNALASQHRDELLRLQGIFRVPGVDELDAGN